MCYKVIIGLPDFYLNGISTFSANLARQLTKQGIENTILLTQTDRSNSYSIKELPRSSEISFQTLEVKSSRFKYLEAHWNAIIEYLENQVPCIYIPNFDFIHSCVSPKLSDRIKIVGTVHCDNKAHYEQVNRLGKYWDAIIAVSKNIFKKVEEIDQSYSKRLHFIPYGVYIPSTIPNRTQDQNSTIKLIYIGRLIQTQKRILDLPKIVDLLMDRNVPFELTVIGNGPEEYKLAKRWKKLIERNVIQLLGTLANEKIYEILAKNDVILLMSEFEGTPMSLLEAMGQGCIPIVTNISSGIPELVEDNISGYRVPIGDIDMFAECIARLQRESNLRKEMSLRSYYKVQNSPYNLESMTRQYIKLFNHLFKSAEANTYKRPKGKIIPPPVIKDSWTFELNAPVRLFYNLLYGFLITIRNINIKIKRR